MAVIGLTACAFLSAAGAAHSPEAQVDEALLSAQLPAQLSYDGEDTIITGSVASLFDSPTFSNTKRDQQLPRPLPEQEALEVASLFDEVRLQISALRQGRDPVTPRPRRPDADPRISVAMIDPALMSAALDAIDSLDGSGNDSAHPFPVSLPQQLAYARDNTPATTFSTPVAKKLSEKAMWCLATAIYFEARGESYRGQAAVAQVVMNRVNHRLYPNTVCGVVFQNQSRRNACQFSFACDGIPERINEKKAWAQAEEISKKITNGSIYLTEVANATHYHATYVYPRWAPRLKRMTKIGLHIFYRFKTS